MAIISYQVQTISNLLSLALAIPEYQRPYKWDTRHVNQLIDDILAYKKKTRYRIGTIVLHQEKEAKFNIVDGQQRLLTLTLICAILGKNQKTVTSSLLKTRFTSPISIKKLKNNTQVIYSRFANLNSHDKQQLLSFILNQCELIVITLDDLNEAFQFFDSQNIRGKALAPHDLLKAYHLREMMDNTEQIDRIKHVELWEQSINPYNNLPNLNTIIGEFLFRIRCWIDGDCGIRFSRQHIDVFKGINLGDINYPYINAMYITDSAIKDNNANTENQWDQKSQSYPFQIDQVLINGKRFFEYIQHYITMYCKLFIDQDALLKGFMDKYTVYENCNRKGDRYVKNLFMCTIMYYYDKFGDVELKQAAKICYCWSYFLRLKLQLISMQSIDNHAKAANGLFRAIRKALYPQQILNFIPPYNTKIRFKNAPSVENAIKSMINGGRDE
ncbi:MAG: DUF262 domain-containing protein [Gilliamella sp.]|uniref:DUF262 domain-containing protein n=1 Tax=Gilliamella sp. TaxID=1891236 RepID=UPI002628BCB2|nr:DUF262 domain-containing protein [Gilliamella sp.]MCO6553237.1 DUF262 domain-containing protein [Gilliamella sp.]